jgi:NAD-dependent deacetylase
MSIKRARALLEQAERVAALTGAGISAESGVPTFRGSAGLWKHFRAEDLATPQAFARDPQLVWEWYDWRRALIANVRPNAGHYALAELERRIRKLTLVTQNVDGLHHEAGSRSVLEIHGSIWDLKCTICNRQWVDRTVPLNLIPRCECGAMARPGVVWFGENLPRNLLHKSEEAVQSCDVFLVVGTSAVVYPAAGLVPLARASGATIIEINLQATPVSGLVDVSLTGPAGEVLPDLMNQA